MVPVYFPFASADFRLCVWALLLRRSQRIWKMSPRSRKVCGKFSCQWLPPGYNRKGKKNFRENRCGVSYILPSRSNNTAGRICCNYKSKDCISHHLVCNQVYVMILTREYSRFQSGDESVKYSQKLALKICISH